MQTDRRRHAVAPVLALLIAALLGWLASVPPRPLGLDAPAGVFSAGRAMADIRAAFSRPHPIGSTENMRVRDELARRMRTIGLAVRVQDDVVARVDGTAITGGRVSNIVGVLPGRDRTLPALLIAAHYDTAPASPGAGDDGFGIATQLEIARILRDRPRARDVVFLMTDGEEAGLLGVRAFMATDPLRRRIGMVLNMDTRGDAGRAVMYETGPNPGALVRLYARQTRDPTSDSIAAFVRRSIRNSSDFAVTAEAGLPGLNYAVLGNQFNYHAASSTPDALDRGSLQQFGAAVLAMAGPLSADAALPAPAAEPAYASLLGRATIVYPHWIGWAILTVAAGLFAVALRRRGTRPRALLLGLAAALAMTVLAGLALHLVRIGSGVPYGFTAVRPLLARWGLFEAALLAAATAPFVLTLGWRRRADLAAGAILLVLLLGTAVQAFAPPAAVLTTWTALAAAGVLLLARATPLTAAALAGTILAQILATAHLIELTVGENLPEVGAPFLLFAAAALAPLVPAGRWPRPVAIALATLAVALTLTIRLTDPTSPARPRPSQILYVADEAGRFWRASSLPAIDAWSDAALKADGAAGWTRRTLPPFFAGRDYRQGVAVAPARPVAVARSVIAADAGRLTVTSPPGTRQLAVSLRFAAPAALLSVGGAPAVARLRPGETYVLRWSAPAGPLSLRYRTTGPGGVTATAAALVDGWPMEARPLAPRSPDTMPWYNSDATLVARRIDVRW